MTGLNASISKERSIPESETNCKMKVVTNWVCFDWSEVTSNDQSKHRRGKLTFGRLQAVSTYVCNVPSTCMCMYLHVCVEFDCVSPWRKKVSLWVCSFSFTGSTPVCGRVFSRTNVANYKHTFVLGKKNLSHTGVDPGKLNERTLCEMNVGQR